MSGVVAACVAMVPDGLVLLTSLAFMAGVVTLARRQALLRELASVELLARVDTLCLDKTGTITTGRVVVTDTVDLDGSADPDRRRTPTEQLLAAIAASDPDPNATLAAVAEAFPDAPDWAVTDTVPFSSARKWSAVAFESGRPRGALYLGAPEFLLGDDAPRARRAGRPSTPTQGRRVLLLAHRRRARPATCCPTTCAPGRWCCSRTRSAPTPARRSSTSPRRASRSR